MSFSTLPGRVAEIRNRIANAAVRGGHKQRVTIVAVTKTFGNDAVQSAFDCGLTDIGENKVQEALTKQASFSLPIHWHLIGHLQRNKVKALEHFALFHAVDSPRLADAINAWASARNVRARVLVQVNVAGEETKGGFSPAEMVAEAARLRELSGLDVAGTMTMAPYDAPEAVLRKCFGGAREARDVLVRAGHTATELSMGMSGDYEIAVEEGATLVRLGTVLFGGRA